MGVTFDGQNYLSPDALTSDEKVSPFISLQHQRYGTLQDTALMLYYALSWISGFLFIFEYLMSIIIKIFKGCHL